MKKILVLITSIFCFAFSKAQSGYPIQQNLGSDSTLVNSKGGMKLRPIVYSYPDTASANNERISQYPFSQIATNDNKYWMRNFTATKWLQFSTGGSAGFPVDSVTSEKINCLDYQSYWSGGVATVFDTIQIYDGIINAGSITETSPRNFKVTQFQYRVNCQYATTPSPDTTLVTLGYDTLPRYYTIAGNTDNEAVLLVGEESENPTPPSLQPNQIFLGYIFETSVGDTIIPAPPTNDIWAGRYRADSISGKWTYFNDTFYLKHLPFTDPFLTFPSPSLVLQTQALDTPSLNQIPVSVALRTGASTGGSIPNFGLNVKAWYNTTATLKTLLDINGATGTANFYNQVAFPGTTTGGITVGGNTMKFQSTNTTLKYDFQNVGAPMGSNGVFMRFDNGATTGGSNSALLYGRGNALQPLIYLGNEGNAGFGTTTPSATAAMDITSSMGGLLIPRMSTAVRDGLGDWVGSVSLSNGGSGYTSAPSVSISGVIGKQPRITATVSGGAVTALTIDYRGTGVPISGALVFNNTGTGGTGAAGTFTQSAGNTIAQWQMIINTDSTSCPIEVWNGSSWVGACGNGGGGSVGTLQQVTTAGNSSDQGILLADTDGSHGLTLTDGTNNIGLFFQGGSGGNLQVIDPASSRLTEITPNGVSWTNSSAHTITIKGDSTTTDKILQWPDVSANNHIIPISVNGNFADINGDITVSGGSGTVTSVATGYGLTGGTITTSGTLSLDSATVYSYVRSLITPVPTDTLQFNTDQFHIRAATATRDSVYIVGNPTQFAYFRDYDSLMVSTDSVSWESSLGRFNIKGTLHIETGTGGIVGQVKSSDASGGFGDFIGDFSNWVFTWDQATGYISNMPTFLNNNVTVTGSLLTNQTTGIDLSSSAFTVSNSGTFQISVSSGNDFILPDPTSFTANTIEIDILVNKNVTANISTIGGTTIYNKTGTVVTSISGGSNDGGSTYRYKPVNGSYHEF